MVERHEQLAPMGLSFVPRERGDAVEVIVNMTK